MAKCAIIMTYLYIECGVTPNIVDKKRLSTMLTKKEQGILRSRGMRLAAIPKKLKTVKW